MAPIDVAKSGLHWHTLNKIHGDSFCVRDIFFFIENTFLLDRIIVIFCAVLIYMYEFYTKYNTIHQYIHTYTCIWKQWVAGIVVQCIHTATYKSPVQVWNNSASTASYHRRPVGWLFLGYVPFGTEQIIYRYTFGCIATSVRFALRVPFLSHRYSVDVCAAVKVHHETG